MSKKLKVPAGLVKALLAKRSFLITTHVRPDGDAIGSQLALYHALRKLGKKVVLRNHSPVPANFRFLPGSPRIETKGPLPFQPEAAIVLDAPSPGRVGKIEEELKKVPILFNIDHHVSNTRYGKFNWVSPQSSSVGEMIFHLLPKLRVKLSRPIALCLYTAILTDMGKFQFMVTPESGVRIFKLLAELVETGLIPYEIYKKVYNLYSTAPLKLLGEALTTLRFSAGGQIAYLDVTRKMQERWGERDDNADHLISFPRDLITVRVAVLFTELSGGRVKVSFRSKEPDQIDVNKIASGFGGGGHPAAAGAELQGSLRAVHSKVLSAVRKELKQVGPRKTRV